ncbi:MAG: 5,6-dimethylbenzimidazole synthase [Rhizobiaceae bacterium]|nr:5,6-dimethylbenzimidazole synthase [Rhizobiaceae bacterium]
MKFTPEDTKQLLELMKWRRDVRHFNTDPVCAKEMNVLREAVALAPSVGNSRPWRFVNVASDEARNSIIENFANANSKASQIYENAKQEEYLKLKLAGLKEAPVHLAVFTDLSPSEGSGLGRQTMPETLTYSTISAIHQLWLAARTRNIGVGWVSILEPEQMNSLLNVPQEWKFTAYLCIGYPKKDHDTPELERRGWQENTEYDWLER